MLHMWLYAPFLQDIQLNPLNYGHTLDEDGNLVLNLSTEPPIPDKFPALCNCLKCSTKVCHVEEGEFRVVNTVNIVQVMSARIHLTV